MYFLIAGLSLKNVLKIENSIVIEIVLFSVSGIIFIIGIYNYFKHKKLILDDKKHIGDYQLEYYE